MTARRVASSLPTNKKAPPSQTLGVLRAKPSRHHRLYDGVGLLCRRATGEGGALSPLTSENRCARGLSRIDAQPRRFFDGEK